MIPTRRVRNNSSHSNLLIFLMGAGYARPVRIITFMEGPSVIDVRNRSARVTLMGNQSIC